MSLLTQALSPLTVDALTTSQFERSIAELAPRLCVFDCDGTLWSGDAGSSFMHYTRDQGLLSADRIAWLADRYHGYREGRVSELAICGDMVTVYAGLAESDLRAAAAHFFRSQIEPHIFPELERLLASLRSQQAEIWAVSSTNHWVIEEGVRRFDIPAARVLAARVEVVDGLATDRLLDVPTDEGKVTALARAGITRPDAVFGNSVHDAAMLAIARRAYPVNPTPALVEHSARAGWPVFYPAAVRPEPVPPNPTAPVPV